MDNVHIRWFKKDHPLKTIDGKFPRIELVEISIDLASDKSVFKKHRWVRIVSDIGIFSGYDFFHFDYSLGKSKTELFDRKWGDCVHVEKCFAVLLLV